MIRMQSQDTSPTADESDIGGLSYLMLTPTDMPERPNPKPRIEESSPGISLEEQTDSLFNCLGNPW